MVEILVTVVCIELAFRIWHQYKFNRPYHVSIKHAWKDSYVIPHPYLSFAYKRNSKIDKNQKLPYELHPNKFYSFKEPLKINSLGHFGPEATKEKTKIRVLCIGASTTANNISDGTTDYTYPSILQKQLGDEYEVLNGGIGGWITPDILINFQLNLLKLNPDIVLLYHGYNDLQYHLMHNVQSDYSHGRKNLGEVLGLIKRANVLPKIRFWHSYEFIKDKLFGTGNVRNDVLNLINKLPINYLNTYESLKIEKDILENIFILCKHHDIKLIPSSFVYYNYKKDMASNKLQKGVELQNKNMKQLSDTYNTPFVDQYKLIPKKKKYFVDTIHFSPDGMKLLAENFGIMIKNLYIK
jgi:lysophospholipase L1-like esterase